MAYSVLCQDGIYSSGEAGWFNARTLSFHQCSLPVVVCECGFADSIPALVGFSLGASVSSYT